MTPLVSFAERRVIIMDKIKVVKSQLRLQQWAERISECQASSMIVSAWCDAHDINIKTYYYWLQKVREVTIENIPVKAANLPSCSKQEHIRAQLNRVLWVQI